MLTFLCGASLLFTLLCTVFMFLVRQQLANLSLVALHQAEALSNVNQNLTTAIASLPKKRAKRVDVDSESDS